MGHNVAYHYQLEDCLDWIIKNHYKRVILQFKPADIGNSTKVLHHLKQAHNNLTDKQETLSLFVTQSNTCCVDLIVTQHISDLDAIIHFGRACLSKPHLANQEKEIPIFFAFTRAIHDSNVIDSNSKKILDLIETITSTNSNCPVGLFYETNLLDYAQYICHALDTRNLNKSVEVAKIILPSPKWSTVACQLSCTSEYGNSVGHYSLSRPIDSYKSAIFLSDKPSISWVLQMPSNVWNVDCSREIVEIEKLNVSRALSKRMALVDRLRDDEELKFGVIITNPLPDFSQVSERLQKYASNRKHILYFITMIQTIDECKIGNFDLCDAFIVINNCSCSQVLESLYFNRPILSEIEFKLACGLEAVYGQVLWPSSDTHQSEDDLINKRKASDVSSALVHSRNELLERCSQARSNLWSGLEFKSDDGVGKGDDYSIEEGLHGIASTYISEPLKKSTD